MKIAYRLIKDKLKRGPVGNGNDLPSVFVAYYDMKETFKNISRILDKICYKYYNWKVCADLKVVALLSGLQKKFTEYCCFLCEWYSRYRNKH